MNSKVINDYCSSCGLCFSQFNDPIKRNNKGYLDPQTNLWSNEKIQEVSKYCPSTSMYGNDLKGTIWGRYEKAWLGWSSNASVRHQASSGGILTSLSIYLLDKKLVYGIIHTAVKDTHPYETETVVSTTKEELISRSGSRYAISSPLLKIRKYLIDDKMYAFIGKPCDVVALRNYLKVHPNLEWKFPYIFSFFCAGLPSNNAQEKLIDRLGCKTSDIKTLRYRGDGWPGFAKVTLSDGTSNSLDYNSSWGQILGRDIMPICRMCLDGVGEQADVSCGDAWYLKKDGTPDFAEHDGRNVVFGRNNIGTRLVEDAAKEGYIVINEYHNMEQELKKSQYHQYMRRSTLIGQFIGMRMLGRKVPMYPTKVLLKYAKEGKAVKQNIKRVAGVVRRGINGKL